MNPIQIVIDTNVLVAAYRSRYGAAFQLLSQLHDTRIEVNVSSALLFAYEAKLKEQLSSDGITELWKADKFLDALAEMANRRKIYFSFRSEEFHADDAFIVDLAIASGAPFVITYNIRHFMGLKRYGKMPITPGDFLRWLEMV